MNNVDRGMSMSDYTTELRFICEELANLTESKPYSSIEDIIEKARTKIFDFAYPLFDNDYKKEFETKIINHFYFREIGFETYGVWKHYLRTTLNEIMPYYNKLYESALLDYDPFNEVDYTKSGNIEDHGTGNKSGDGSEETNRTDNYQKEGTETGTGSTENIGKNTERFSDTPQGSLQDIESNNYLTNAKIIDTKSTTNSENNIANNESGNSTTAGTRNNEYREDTKNDNIKTYVEKVAGKVSSRSFSELLEAYRQTFLNIDMMVISELESLFMLIY